VLSGWVASSKLTKLSLVRIMTRLAVVTEAAAVVAAMVSLAAVVTKFKKINTVKNQ
jgi:hypothetical protein